VIKGEKTLLRPLNDADIEIICQWEAGQHIATAAFETQEQTSDGDRGIHVSC